MACSISFDRDFFFDSWSYCDEVESAITNYHEQLRPSLWLTLCRHIGTRLSATFVATSLRRRKIARVCKSVSGPIFGLCSEHLSVVFRGIGFIRSQAPRNSTMSTIAEANIDITRSIFLHSRRSTSYRLKRSWGPFLERPGKLSGPVSHPVSPRKLFGCFSKLPLFSIPLIFPVTCPVIYGRS